MKRGRPVYSKVRSNMAEILYHLGSGYGYEIAKIYLDIFPKVSRRLFYYHLKKGVELGIFKVEKIQKEQGDYSWGNTAEKIYYSLDSNATPRGSARVLQYLKKIKR